jgi:hypothetical protein
MQNPNRETWKRRPQPKRHERVARDVSRAAIVCFLGGLIGLLLFFLFAPFFAPRTHLVLLDATPDHAFGIEPLRYDAEDLDGLEQLDGVSVHRTTDWLRSAQSAQTLATEIDRLGVGAADTVIVYVAAHGISTDGKPYVLARPLDSRHLQRARIPVETLLQQISRSSAKRKLVLLNAGSIDCDPRLGMVVNEFPRLLRQVVAGIGDPNLWVLCSHREFEISHASPAAGRSVFGMFVDHALRGAADLDGDRSVSLREVSAFTTANVSAWVAHQTDRMTSQHPQLLWAGSDTDTQADPPLVRLESSPADADFSVASLIGAEGDGAAAGLANAASPAAPGSQGVLRRHQVRLVSASSATAATQTQDPPPDGSATATDGSDGGEKAAAAARAAQSQSMRLLQQAWDQRDRLARRWSPLALGESPIDNLPHLWREFETELLDLEQRVATGQSVDLTRLNSVLGQTPPDNANASQGGASALSDVFAAKPSSASRILDDPPPHSFAVAQLLSVDDAAGKTLDLNALHAALAAATSKPLDAWLKKFWNDSLSRYVEFQQLRDWAQRSDLDWPTIRLAITTRFSAERAAALDALACGWVRRHVEVGDQYLLSACDLLQRSATAATQTRATQWFETAAAAYADAQADFQIVRQAQRLRDQVFSELPALLRARRASIVTARPETGRHELSRMLDHLQRLCDDLRSPAPATVPSLRETIKALHALRNSTLAAFDDRAVASLADRPAIPGDGWTIDRLLRTPLISAASRRTLTGIATKIDRDVALQWQLPTLRRTGETDAAAASAEPNRSVWAALFEQAQLEYGLICLTSCGGEPGACLHAAGEAMQQLRRAHQQWANVRSDDASIRKAEDALWQAHARLGGCLAAFYRNLAALPQAGEEGAVHDGASLARTLRVIDARDAWRFRKLSIDALTSSSRLRSTLNWQSSRLQQALIYDVSFPAEQLREAIETYQRTAVALGGGPADETDRPRLTIRSTDRPDLQYQRSQTTEVLLENPSDRDVDVALLIDYPDEALRVDLPAESSSELSFREDTTGLAHRRSNRIHLNAGGRIGFSVTVRRTDALASAAWLAIDAIDVSATTGPDELLGRPALARQVVPVTMPVAELVVIDDERSFQSDVDGLTLHPFANRPGDVRLGIAGAAPGSTVSVRCHSLTAESAARTDDQLAERFSAAEPLIAFRAKPASDGAITFPAPSPTGSPAAATDVGKSGGDAGKQAGPEKQADKQAGGAKPTDATPKADLSAGLFVILQDDASGRATYRRVQFAVQRPARFLQPNVRYDAVAKRVDIQLAAIDPSLLPDGKPVRIRCGLAAPLAGRERGSLRTELSRRQPQASLFVRLPSPVPEVVRLHLDVDGFPRGFQYRIATDTSATMVPEVRGRVEARIQTQSGDGYLAATDSVPVGAEIDCPPGFFDSGHDFLELGMDLDADGVPDPDTAVRLTNDRSVSIEGMSAGTDGKLNWFARVSDFQVDVPLAGVENVPVKIAGRLVVGHRSQPIRGIPIYVDTAPPIVGPVNGDRVSGPNQPIELSVWTSDDGSGAKRVEAVFDTTGSGTFPEKAKPVAATPSGDDSWSLTLPAPKQVGEHLLLVRAIDRVGNASDPITHRVTVMKEVPPVDAPSKVLRGFVSFAGQPHPAATVTVTANPQPARPDAKAASPIRVQPRATGEFSVGGLKPGKYTVTARAVIRNRVRTAKSEVVLSDKQPPAVKLELQ